MQPSPRARTHMRAREWTAAVGVSDHSSMPAFPRCGALLRNGQPCGRTVADGSEFCVHHIKLLETVDAQAMRQGRTPKKRALKESGLRVVAESPPEPVATTGPATVTNADPSTVRPLLAAAAAENVEQLKASLLEAAGSAVKPVWLTVECSSSGERSRVEAPVPDVRSRVSAIELLLREGLGRPATAEEVRSPRMPVDVDAVRTMGWEEMQALFAATYAEEIAAAQQRGGKALMREKLAALTVGQRSVLREALDEFDRA
jgi:hypothetical protein